MKRNFGFKSEHKIRYTNWAINNTHKKTTWQINPLPMTIELNWADPIQTISNKPTKSANDILHATYKEMSLHFIQFGCVSLCIHL